MSRTLQLAAASIALAAAFGLGRGTASAAPGRALSYFIEHDADVAKQEAGTHGGGGSTTGYSFFAKVPGLPMVFRKRALHPGSAIGYHPHGEDEIYYVLSGRGELTMDGAKSMVGPGTAMLIRDGSSHGLKQVGAEDLVIIITYPNKPAAAAAAK
jgi:mannose-6-phosphate isomerase-like protein (cupin superfamily)